KYIVRLSTDERQACNDVVGQRRGTSEKVRRSRILLKADADGPAPIDEKTTAALNCRTQTSESVRYRPVTEIFEKVLDRKT
ncbi:MAG TPA: hypothetical protein EYG03_10310, partial [Planctomycetes bacterium]|nr:hypothetical protein [Planctomycetota bacterium]